MQHRMRTHILSKEEIDDLLSSALTASLATLNSDGSPYVTPVHFLFYEGSIYIHGLSKGQKISNIEARPKVGMAVYMMDSFLLDPSGMPCDTNTKYKSVIISGQAGLLEDAQVKKEILSKIVEKYTPGLVGKKLPDGAVGSTAVIKIKMLSVTGKYYP